MSRYRVHYTQGYASDIQTQHSTIVDVANEREARGVVLDRHLFSCEGRITKVELADCCASCGDYAGPGRETCERCTKPANGNIPEDNWRRSVRYPRSRYR